MITTAGSTLKPAVLELLKDVDEPLDATSKKLISKNGSNLKAQLSFRMETLESILIKQTKRTHVCRCVLHVHLSTRL
jgi:hypothetical protein